MTLACAAPATAQAVGAIGGTITDESGAVLPGVNVTLSSPQTTIGANQQSSRCGSIMSFT
jgi:hypothetical protein